jgi:hypothetical protein
MDFMKILKSFEEFIFEAVSWLVFFPLTLWRVVRHPLRMARYADEELSDPLREQFKDALSPPLFLLLALLIAHALEIVTQAQLPEQRNRLAEVVFGTEQNLLMYRTITFGVWPLIGSLYLLRRQRIAIDRETLRRPFYVQCYLAAPFALVLSTGAAFVGHAGTTAPLVGAAIMLVACVWYVAVQSHWLRHVLAVPWWRAWLATLWVLAMGIAINTAVAIVLLSRA